MAAATPLLRDSALTPAPAPGRSFAFDAPIVAFSKADVPEGQQRRIAGIISTDGLDQQNERLIQEGLSFKTFLARGWFNNNHSNESVTEVVGYPDVVDQYKKGDKLPNGKVSEANCTWAEGYLIGHKGRQIWEIAKDLQGSKRQLGFSVEGTINKRDAKDRSVILSAEVVNVALTHAPVNVDCQLEVLARSLNPQGDLGKTMSFGDTPAQSADHPLPQPVPNKVYTGEGVGKVLTAQNPPPQKKAKAAGKRRKKRSKPAFFTRSQAMAYLKSCAPGLKRDLADRILKTAQAMADHGLL